MQRPAPCTSSVPCTTPSSTWTPGPEQQARTASPPELVIDSRQLAAATAHLAALKKAPDIRVYDVDEQLKFADYFVIVTAGSRPQVKAIYNELHVRLKAAGERHAKAEGLELGWWVLLDYVDVVVHVLQPEAREYYGLDTLYSECPQLDWQSVELPELPEPSARAAE